MMRGGRPLLWFFLRFHIIITAVSRLERIMDMINVLCLDDGRLDYGYIRDKYGISNREFRRDIDFIRERLTDIGYMDKQSSVEYVRRSGGNYYVYNGDKPRLNEAFVNSTIAEALSRVAYNPLKVQFGSEEDVSLSSDVPVKYLYTALEKVNYAAFTKIVNAIKERRIVSLRYVNSKRGETVLRVNPMLLINYSQIWYLKAESEYGTIITYSLSRIKEVTYTDSHFEYNREKLERSEGSYGIFSSAKKEPVWYTMRFYSVAANIISNQIWHSEQKGKWLDDNTYEISVPAVSDVEVMARLLSYAPESEAVSPPQFVSRWKDIIRQCAAKLDKEEV